MDIQGYIPAIRNGDTRRFVKFNGGFTDDYLKAYCAATSREALNIATNCLGTCKQDAPEAVPLDGECKLVL